VEEKGMMNKMVLPAVVVADPDPASQQQIVELLKSSFQCIVTGTLAETYQLIRRERPPMLILELNQPDGDGIKLIQALQADPALRQVLIACVTSRSTIKDKIAAFRVGADDYLVKPLTPSMNFYGRMLLLRRAGHIARTAR
jgi:DNA-binding response OmpR family regulator